MLILKRKAGESITINGNIKIKILNVGTVHLGIDAPKNIKIIRDELLKSDKSLGRTTCNPD